MPYTSKKQAAFMHINHPEIAKRWDAEMDSNPNRPLLAQNDKGNFNPFNPEQHQGISPEDLKTLGEAFGSIYGKKQKPTPTPIPTNTPTLTPEEQRKKDANLALEQLIRGKA